MKIKKIINLVSAIFFFIITLCSFIVMIFLFMQFRALPEINDNSLAVALSTKIYDKENKLIATVGNERREFIDSKDIPENVKNAVLSVEDSRFESHIGLDPKRIIKALIVNLDAGSSLEGGSTITQQVVKTSLLNSKKTYNRKLKEALLSLKLEIKYTKEDILEMYLNKIFYSDHQYGIKSAARYFYVKDVSELSIDEIALLAGIPQQPAVYNPYDNPETAKNRRNIVLYSMYKNDKISLDQYNEFSKKDITENLIKRNPEDRRLQSLSNSKYGAYVDLVMKEINQAKLVENEEDPFALGLHIYTNLNGELQDYVQNMLDNQSLPMKPHASQAALTILDTKTGLVEAVGGGKNYKFGGFNFAIDSKLQPGSSIKPIFDYAPGIEYYGWDSETIFLDSPYLIAGTNRYIQNWDRLYHGNVSMRRAIAMSYNIPAVRAFEEVGFERSKYFASKLDINLSSEQPTSAIGGNVETVSPLTMAGAFATFGNKGYYNKPSGIIKVLDNSGNEITNKIKKESKKAMNESTAYIITNMLKDVVTYNGTSPNAAVLGYDLAAKSGSTTFDETLARNYNIDSVNATKDSWLIGYTTDYTVAVWQGADNVDSAAKALSSANTVTTQFILADLIKKVHNGKVPAKFEMPETVEKIGNIYIPKDRSTETDNMYVGTHLDAVYKSRKIELERENKKITREINILKNQETISNKSSTITNKKQTSNKKNN